MQKCRDFKKLAMKNRFIKLDAKIIYGILSGLVAFIVSLLYWKFALQFWVTKFGNIICYACFLIIFMFFFVGGFFLVGRLVKKQLFSMPSIAVAVITGGGILCVIFSLTPFLDDVWKLPRVVTVPLILLIALFALGNVIFEDKKNKQSTLLLMLVVAFFSFLWGVAVATGNTINTFYDMHHSSAYMQSIYNVFYHESFQGGMTDQYGHYALLFYIPMKVFGLTSRNIAITLGILSMLTFIFAMSAFCMVVKSNAIRYITITTTGISGIVVRLEGIYWQCYPHRLIFPALMMFMIAFFIQHQMKARGYFIGSVVVMISVLWNFESGIICCAAWIVFTILYTFQNYDIKCKRSVILLAISCGQIVFSIFGSFVIVNCYNILVGGSALHLRDYFGVLLDSSYMEWLRDGGKLLFGNVFYLHKISAFFVTFGWGIIHNRVFGIKGSEAKAVFAAVVSVMGLGLFTYYINRPLAGDKLIDLFFLIDLGVILSGMKTMTDDKGKRSCHPMKIILAVYAVLVFSGFILSGLRGYEKAVTQCNYGVYNYAEFQKFADEVGKEVPDGTWGDGEGVTAIFMELGRDKKTRKFDEVTTEAMRGQQSIFLYSKYYGAVPQEEYQLVKEFNYKGLIFGYFTRKIVNKQENAGT